jgi:hemolysin III
MIKKMKDPVSALSHLIGAVLSVVGLVLLVYRSVLQANPWHITAFAIYGASLVLLYTASTIYHAIPASERWTRILRKIDHSMIYVLIAGTYTPFCLIALRGVWGWSLLTSIWTLTVAGIILTIVWIDAPRWFSTSVYALLGWIAVIPTIPLIRSISAAGMAWVAVGGLLYTVGAIIYGTKWPRINSRLFGFHEIFHIFVIGGSIAHFWVMANFVLPLA